MFFDNLSDVENIARRTGTSVFVLPETVELKIKNALVLAPEKKSTITIDQVRDIFSLISTKQTSDRFIIIRPAEKLGDEAANALLKNLEEPREKVHFLLVTPEPSRLLPTILSRAAVYFLRVPVDLNSPITADNRSKDLARRLIAARPADLPDLAEAIAKKKDGVRAYALSILSIAIEILYKSYFKTENSVFLAKIPKFLATYDAISVNGNVKLQIVANLC